MASFVHLRVKSAYSLLEGAVRPKELTRLAHVIADLPGKVRDVFILRRVHGLSQREVAERLGLSESTVEKHMARGFLIMLELARHGGNQTPHPSSSRSRNNGTFRFDDKKDRASD